MPSLISSKPLSIVDFQDFSTNTSTSDHAIVGKKFLGGGLKQISSLNFQWAFGGTTSIINDFQKALRGKYGHEIADFVFSSENKKEALAKGLSKQTIAAVLRKAESLEKSPLKDEFFSYQKVVGNKQEIIQNTIKDLSGDPLKKAQKKYFEIKKAWKDCADVFDDWCSSKEPSEETTETLKSYFQEKLQVVDQLAREIIAETETKEKNIERELQPISRPSEKTTELIGETLVTENTAAIFQQELGVPEEKARDSVAALKRLGEPFATQLMRTMAEQRSSLHAMNNAVDEIVQLVQEGDNLELHENRNSAENELPDFINEIDDSPKIKQFLEKNPQIETLFDNLTRIPEILKTEAEHLKMKLQPFIDASSTSAPNSYFYLDRDSSKIAIHSLQVESSSPPTMEEQQAAAEQFFSILKSNFGEKLIDLLVPPDQQNQPLSLHQTQEIFHNLKNTLQETSKFLEENPIFITPQYLLTLAENQEAAALALESHQQSSEGGHTFIDTMREMGICGMLFSGTKIALTVAGGCTPTLPCIIIALSAAAMDGYLMGRFVAREEGLSSDEQQNAGELAATATTGSAAGIILERATQQIINPYIPEVLWSSLTEYGGSYIALALRNAARGGARSAEEELARTNHRLSGDDVAFLEARLVHFFGLQSYLDRLISAFGSIGSSTSTAPSSATAASTHDAASS